MSVAKSPITGALAAIVAIPVLAFVALATFNNFGSEGRDQAAKSFCSRIKAGTPLQAVMLQAKNDGIPHYNEGAAIHFTFYGPTFTGPYCAVVHEAGLITRAVVGKDNWQ
jgi:hypothetical protein